MNSSNSIGSLDTGEENSASGWGGTMGESGGFGQTATNAPLSHHPQGFVQSPPPVITSTPDMYAASTTSQGGYISQFAAMTTETPQHSSMQHQQQQQGMGMYNNTPTHGPGYTSPMAHSSVPNANSFMARSQQAYNVGSLQQPQQQQLPHQQHIGGGGGGGGSYAQRSQQAYGGGGMAPQSQPQQQQPMNPAVGSTGAIATGELGNSALYMARSQQGPYGGAPSQPGGMPYGTVGGGPVPQQMSYRADGAGSHPPTSAAPTGSYAARSAAAALYGSQQQHSQQPIAQQPQQFQPQAQPYAPQSYGNTNNFAPQTVSHPGGNMPAYVASSSPPVFGLESTQQQQKILTDATRKVQEHAYYMKQAMEQPHINNLAVVLDRAAHMVGELGGPPHGGPTGAAAGGGSGGAPSNTGGSAKLTPKNYYELYMRALEDMPALEEYLIQLSSRTEEAPPPLQPDMIRIVDHASQLSTAAAFPPPKNLTMRQLYECVQYCPRVVSRLYLQIAAGSALIRSGECGAKWVMHDLQQAVKCEQNPVRGLFLRNFLLTALRDKLPDSPLPVAAAPKREAAIAAEAEDGDDNGKQDDDSAADYDDVHLSRKEVSEDDKGTVKDSYEFVLANFMEMNKLWVRIQHLPGEGNNKDVRKRRERERNDLRILVGTNLVRLSQLECVTSKIYGEAILPHILEHIVTTGDPLSQAYLMDCLVQVFPDEYHIETLPILLNVCPRLRDKVNIRTILQGLMDRLAKYLAEEELLDESDTNQVKKVSTGDSFNLFDECVQKVYNARGPRLTHKEVIRLQTALLQFSIKCFPGNMEQVSQCINSCVSALRQASAFHEVMPEGAPRPQSTKVFDDASIVELEKLLSIPLDSLALRVLELEQYSHLIGFLPWANRRGVAITMLKAVENTGPLPMSVADIEQLFKAIEPLVRDEVLGSGMVVGNANGQLTYQQTQHGMVQGLKTMQQSFDPVQLKRIQEENSHVSKLIHSLDHKHTDVVFEMLLAARNHMSYEGCNPNRVGNTLVALIFRAIKLALLVFNAEQGSPAPASTSNEKTTELASKQPTSPDEVTEGEEVAAQTPATEINSIEASKALSFDVSCRKIFVFIQECIATLAKHRPEKGFCLYLEASSTADRLASKAKEDGQSECAMISTELSRHAIALYEENITDGQEQVRCVSALCGTLLSLRTVTSDDYESLITKTAQFSAKITTKPDQCRLVALCAHLFYPIGGGNDMIFSNAQRALECLQRSLKLADACTSMNPVYIGLFVDLLEHYVFFFEKGNPLITHAYVTGLVALIKEHLGNLNAIGSDGDAKAHFIEVVRYIKQKSVDEATAELFSQVRVGS